MNGIERSLNGSLRGLEALLQRIEVAQSQNELGSRIAGFLDAMRSFRLVRVVFDDVAITRQLLALMIK